ncbi:MAG: OmpA family protein [Actinobacteria bacterium]|nr:OmpA family protein [Actinomycetota bacterium]
MLRTPLAVSSGTGFKAGSPVRMYILPSTYIGELMADASGNYSGSLPVPVGVLAGDQTLQANGFSPSGAVRSLSLGIEVKRGREVTTKAEKGSVFFEPLSTVISPQGEATLNGLVRKAKKQGVRTVVLGFVQETTTTSNDGSLSTQRARAVASYLRDRGLKGAYSVRGDGVGGPGDAARRVNVNVTYQSGC